MSDLPQSHPALTAQAWSDLASRLAGLGAILVPASADGEGSPETALSMVSNWNALGFALHAEDVVSLSRLSRESLVHLDAVVTPALREALGGHVSMEPMYPGFPKQIMKASEAELQIRSLLHYAGHLVDLRILPVTDGSRHRKLPKASVKQRPLRLLDGPRLRLFLSDLVSMNAVWTPAQASLAAVALPVLAHEGLVGPLVDLPQRENRAVLCAQWLAGVGAQRLERDGTAWDLSDRLKFFCNWPSLTVSVTDILRAAVAYSGGDPSLSARSGKVRFARMSRPQRRALIAAFEVAAVSTSEPLLEMHRRRESFLRLGEKLHAGEWKDFPQARDLFDRLRNASPPKGWQGRLDQILSVKPTARPVSALCALFAENPGYAARALRRCLVWSGGRSKPILDQFEAVAPSVSTPLLLSLRAAMRSDLSVKGGEPRTRVIFPKGDPSRRYVETGGKVPTRPAMRRVFGICESVLLDRFSRLPALGYYHVEPGLENVLIPKGLRSSSESMLAVARGSSLSVPADVKILRLFLWWKEDGHTGRVDVDLSAIGVDESGGQADVCAWTDLRAQGLVHSGDLVSAPNGAAEFVDVNIAKLNKQTRYVILSANVYSGPVFSALPECFVGWEDRTGKGMQGQVHELPSVAEKFTVRSASKGFLAVAFDVKERRVIWMDLPLRVESYHCMRDGVPAIEALRDLRQYASQQTTVADLVDLHTRARIGRAAAPHLSNLVFSALPRLPLNARQTVIAATRPEEVASGLMA